MILLCKIHRKEIVSLFLHQNAMTKLIKKIKSHWRMVTFVVLVLGYGIFIMIMKQPGLLLLTGAIYMLTTTLLFLGTIVGIPGIVLHMFLKKEHAAIPFYKASVSLRTENTNILTAYGLFELRNYNPESALELFDKALKTTKHYFYHKTLKANTALCYWKMGDTKTAMEMYESILYYPDLEPITDFSLENLEEGLEKNPNFSTADLVTLAFVALMNEETEKALYFTTVALEQQDDYGPAYDNLGQIAYQAGDYETAKENFKKGLEYKPGMIDSQYYLSMIAVKENDLDTAREYYEAIDYGKLSGLSTIDIDDIEGLGARLQ